MTLPIVYRSEVKDDVESAYDWYESQREGLGEELLTAISQAVNQIIVAPRRAGQLRGKARVVVTRRFPYVIYYVVQDDRILVLGILHGKRDPSVWQARLEGD